MQFSVVLQKTLHMSREQRFELNFSLQSEVVNFGEVDVNFASGKDFFAIQKLLYLLNWHSLHWIMAQVRSNRSYIILISRQAFVVTCLSKIDGIMAGVLIPHFMFRHSITGQNLTRHYSPVYLLYRSPFAGRYCASPFPCKIAETYL